MINNAIIIDKMMKELQIAKDNQNNQDVLLKRIGNVQLLCELFLEQGSDDSTTAESQTISDQEAKMMFGDHYIKQTEKSVVEELDHDDANGKSIFDF